MKRLLLGTSTFVRAARRFSIFAPCCPTRVRDAVPIRRLRVDWTGQPSVAVAGKRRSPVCCSSMEYPIALYPFSRRSFILASIGNWDPRSRRPERRAYCHADDAGALQVGVAVKLTTYLAFTCFITCSKVKAEI